MESQGLCERFDKALISLLDMNGILRDDLNALLDAFPDQRSQVLRRNFVRASWAYVEAITHAFKLMVSMLVSEGACKLEPKEAAFLERPRTATLTNIEQTIKLVAKVFSVPECNIGNGADWRHVGPSMKIRNRLVHPKSMESLHVTDSEWDTHRDGFVWLVEAFDGLLTDISGNGEQRNRGS
ncbi:hypothetical protein [Stutzerimonas stutzeri]|nr:hypothetical protein [Stutzerimonas stutzeri]